MTASIKIEAKAEPTEGPTMNPQNAITTNQEPPTPVVTIHPGQQPHLDHAKDLVADTMKPAVPDALVPVAASPQKPRIEIDDTPDGPVARVVVTPEAVRLLGGSAEPKFNALILTETLLCVRIPPCGEDGSAERLAAVTAALEAFKPKDELEGMLAAQAVALHFGAMECLRRSILPDQPFDFATKLRKDGANLARGMTDMLDALDRKRGKGPQIMRVERVVVHEGGQAIVGNVQPVPGGHGKGEGG